MTRLLHAQLYELVNGPSQRIALLEVVVGLAKALSAWNMTAHAHLLVAGVKHRIQTLVAPPELVGDLSDVECRRRKGAIEVPQNLPRTLKLKCVQLEHLQHHAKE